MAIRSKSVLFFCFLFLSFQAQAVVIPFLDQTEWEAALSTSIISTENFDGDQTRFDANSVDNEIGNLSIDLFGGVGDPGPTGLTGEGFLQSEVDSSGADALSTEFNFTDSWGFALLGLQNNPASNGFLDLSEMALEVDGFSFVISDLYGETDADVPFLGFVSDTLIDSFSFIHAGLVTTISRTSEVFYLDGLMLAENFIVETEMPPTSVPEPPLFMLLITGLSALYLVRRNKRPGQSS